MRKSTIDFLYEQFHCKISQDENWEEPFLKEFRKRVFPNFSIEEKEFLKLGSLILKHYKTTGQMKVYKTFRLLERGMQYIIKKSYGRYLTRELYLYKEVFLAVQEYERERGEEYGTKNTNQSVGTIKEYLGIKPVRTYGETGSVAKTEGL